MAMHYSKKLLLCVTGDNSVLLTKSHHCHSCGVASILCCHIEHVTYKPCNNNGTIVTLAIVIVSYVVASS